MRFILGLAIYRLLLPLLFLAAVPAWLVKMLRRGGFRTRLGERIALYPAASQDDAPGATHLHAVSVGEAMLALKLIREWRLSDPDRRFVLATGTATGHAVATAAQLHRVRVTYAPLDFPAMVRRYLRHFAPAQIILIEGEAWPNLLLACHRRHLSVSLVNARLSPRSAARYLRFAAWIQPVFALLDAIAIQEPEDAAIWLKLGIPITKIHATGSLKIDPSSGPLPARRPEFQAMIDAFAGSNKTRPIGLAASTHAGEEPWIATAIRNAVPDALALIVPRHAERREQVKSSLQRCGFDVILRSTFVKDHESWAIAQVERQIQQRQTRQEQSRPDRDATKDASIDATNEAGNEAGNDLTKVTPACLVIDTTGELRDWTAHADLVIIGKSFLATGGQNPCEAILAGKPVIFGPHMQNFQPLATSLIAADAAFLARDQATLSAALLRALDPAQALAATTRASAILTRHHGATRRIVKLLTQV